MKQTVTKSRAPASTTITVGEYKALRASNIGRRSNKYHARKTGVHASAKEHRRAGQLQLMQQAGLISGLREQVSFELIPAQKDENGKTIERNCRYIADFVYTDNSTGQTVVEDTKGFRTKEYRIKRKLMLFFHRIRIKEV